MEFGGCSFVHFGFPFRDVLFDRLHGRRVGRVTREGQRVQERLDFLDQG